MVLPAGRLVAALTDRDFFRFAPCHLDNGWGHEVVIQNNIGGLERTQGLERQKLGVAGARADKGNRSSDSSRRTRSRLGEQRGKIAISRGASRRQRPPTE